MKLFKFSRKEMEVGGILEKEANPKFSQAKEKNKTTLDLTEVHHQSLIALGITVPSLLQQKAFMVGSSVGGLPHLVKLF